MPGKHPSHSATNISELSGSVVNWLGTYMISLVYVRHNIVCSVWELFLTLLICYLFSMASSFAL